MKCPRCRREVAFNAVRHSECGWSVSSGGVAAAAVEIPATREEREAHMEKIRAVLKRPVVKQEKRESMLEDVGHGAVCTCEFCWAARMRMVFPDAVEVVAPGPRPQVESRLERLKKMFPVE